MTWAFPDPVWFCPPGWHPCSPESQTDCKQRKCRASNILCRFKIYILSLWLNTQAVNKSSGLKATKRTTTETMTLSFTPMTTTSARYLRFRDNWLHRAAVVTDHCSRGKNSILYETNTYYCVACLQPTLSSSSTPLSLRSGKAFSVLMISWTSFKPSSCQDTKQAPSNQTVDSYPERSQ